MNQTYVVKSGDTLWGISNQFGVSVTELARINNVKADTLRVGQVLIIPNLSGSNPSNMFMYEIKKGDSLYSIAKKYNTTVNEIIDINNLTNTNLKVGDIIRIPEQYTPEEEIKLPNFINYTVKNKDTLYSIAKEYNTTVKQLIDDNSLINPILSLGQNLKIRINNGDNILVEECFGEDFIEANNTNTLNYAIKKGDNLYSIAKEYNSTIPELMALNGLKTTNLSIGEIIKIPINNNITTYTVKKGDSLYSIAKKYNTTVNNIKSKNNLTSNNLSIGQILKI